MNKNKKLKTCHHQWFELRKIRPCERYRCYEKIPSLSSGHSMMHSKKEFGILIKCGNCETQKRLYE